MNSPYGSYKDWEDEFFSDEVKATKKSPSLVVVFLAGMILVAIAGLLVGSVVTLSLRIAGWSDVLTFKQAFGIGIGYSAIRMIDIGMFKSRL